MSRLLWIPVGAVSALVLSIIGCGSIGGADGLFDSGGAGSGGATGAGGAASATTTSAVSTGETTSSAASTTSSATTGATSSSAATSSSTSAASSSAASSSSTGGVVEMLSCGGATCPFGDESACCWSKFAMPSSTGACVQGTSGDVCKTSTSNGGYKSRLECQNSAQCDGGVCCGHRTFFYQQGQQKFFYETLSCVADCAASDVTICDPMNAADVCPMIATQGGMVQGVCKTSTSLPPGYFVCGAP